MDCVEEIPVPGNKFALKWGGIPVLHEIVRFFSLLEHHIVCIECANM
jgi:hypothetical protein